MPVSIALHSVLLISKIIFKDKFPFNASPFQTHSTIFIFWFYYDSLRDLLIGKWDIASLRASGGRFLGVQVDKQKIL